MEQAIHENYTIEEFVGVPLSVQVVGRRLEEEKVLAMMRVVDEAVKNYKSQ